jgi:hypothetical protein
MHSKRGRQHFAEYGTSAKHKYTTNTNLRGLNVGSHFALNANTFRLNANVSSRLQGLQLVQCAAAAYIIYWKKFNALSQIVFRVVEEGIA